MLYSMAGIYITELKQTETKYAYEKYNMQCTNN